MTDALQQVFHRAPWMSVAWHEARNGVGERSPSKNSAQIMTYLRTTKKGTMGPNPQKWHFIPTQNKHPNKKGIGSKNLKGDEIAWCSAFVNWCFEKINVHGTGHLGAQSWLKWSYGINIRVAASGAITVVDGGKHVAF
jgi:hypothetical protein